MERESRHLPGVHKKAHPSTLKMMFPPQGIPEVPASDLLRPHNQRSTEGTGPGWKVKCVLELGGSKEAAVGIQCC